MRPIKWDNPGIVFGTVGIERGSSFHIHGPSFHHFDRLVPW